MASGSSRQGEARGLTCMVHFCESWQGSHDSPRMLSRRRTAAQTGDLYSSCELQKEVWRNHRCMRVPPLLQSRATQVCDLRETRWDGCAPQQQVGTPACLMPGERVCYALIYGYKQGQQRPLGSGRHLWYPPCNIIPDMMLLRPGRAVGPSACCRRPAGLLEAAAIREPCSKSVSPLPADG